MIRLELPWPPSTNVYWRHVGAKVLLSEAGRAYARSVSDIWLIERLKNHWPMQTEPVRVEIVAHQPDKRKRDLDNLLKGSLDAMTKAKVWRDDSLVHDLRIRWGENAPGGRLVVEIKAMGA